MQCRYVRSIPPGCLQVLCCSTKLAQLPFGDISSLFETIKLWLPRNRGSALLALARFQRSRVVSYNPIQFRHLTAIFIHALTHTLTHALPHLRFPYVRAVTQSPIHPPRHTSSCLWCQMWQSRLVYSSKVSPSSRRLASYCCSRCVREAAGQQLRGARCRDGTVCRCCGDAASCGLRMLLFRSQCVTL